MNARNSFRSWLPFVKKHTLVWIVSIILYVTCYGSYLSYVNSIFTTTGRGDPYDWNCRFYGNILRIWCLVGNNTSNIWNIRKFVCISMLHVESFPPATEIRNDSTPLPIKWRVSRLKSFVQYLFQSHNRQTTLCTIFFSSAVLHFKCPWIFNYKLVVNLKLFCQMPSDSQLRFN